MEQCFQVQRTTYRISLNAGEQLQLLVEIRTIPTEILKLMSCQKVQRQALLHTGAFPFTYHLVE